MTAGQGSQLLIGWASRDMTPERPVLLWGQFHARVSERVMDPVTVTVLALESIRDGLSAGRVVMVSCDLVAISDGLRKAVRERLQTRAPELAPHDICIHATHTHTSLETGGESAHAGSLSEDVGVPIAELGTMEPAEVLVFAAERIASAAAEAWRSRAPGGISFGLGHAVVGHNRRVSYFTGETRMYGKTDDPEFSHIEGRETPLPRCSAEFRIICSS